jgi:hypothetical protein
VLRSEEKYSFFSPADVEFNDTTRAIVAAVERVKPARIVFDPFSDIRHLVRDTLRYRRQILALADPREIERLLAVWSEKIASASLRTPLADVEGAI